MKTVNPPFRLQKPGGDHWSSISIGRAGFVVAMLLTPKNQSIVVEVVIQPEWKDAAFEQLQTQADAIHSELGGRKLDWRPMPEKQSARILLEEKIDPRQESNRKAVCAWFTEWTPKIYLAFKERNELPRSKLRGIKSTYKEWAFRSKLRGINPHEINPHEIKGLVEPEVA